MKISLCMIVKNEEKNLRSCLENATPYVNEIIIVDTGSTDSTKEIACEFGARVFDFKWNNDFSEARNFSLRYAENDWILVLDADEIIKKFDLNGIKKILNNDQKIGRILIESFFLKDNQKLSSKNMISRFFPKGTFFDGKIHEQIDSNLHRIDLPIEVVHSGYFMTDKSNRNIPILEKSLESDKNNPYLLYQLGKEYKSKKDHKKSSQLFESAYLNATKNDYYYPGLVTEFLYSLIEIKDYEKTKKVIDSEQNQLSFYPDFHFVSGIFYLNYVLSDPNKNINFLPLIEQSYLKCIEIGDIEKFDSVKGSGSFLAAYNLGTMYETFGLIDKAKNWYNFSAENGYEPAKSRLVSLEKSLK